MTTFLPLVSVIASLSSTPGTLPPVRGLQAITRFGESDVLGVFHEDHPCFGDCQAFCRFIAAKFSTRIADGKTLMHDDIRDDMVQAIACKVFDRAAKGSLYGFDAYPNLGAFIAGIAYQTCKDLNAQNAAQNPNRMLVSRKIGKTPGTGGSKGIPFTCSGEAWAGYLASKPAPLFGGAADVLPLDLVKANRTATEQDWHVRHVDRCLDSGRDVGAMANDESLTDTEREIVSLLSLGRSTRDIASALNTHQTTIVRVIHKIRENPELAHHGE